MIHAVPYDPAADPVIHALIAEAEADPDVLGLVLQGSRALGVVTPESDYDVVFVISDEAVARHEAAGSWPERAKALADTIDIEDIWSEPIGSIRLEAQPRWGLSIWLDARVVYDRAGEVTRAVETLRRIPEAQAEKEIAEAYDGYLNGMYRSLKCWRRGDALGGRLEAAETAPALVQVLFALERRWKPFSSRLRHHLHELDGQGWQPGEVETILLDLCTSGEPERQQQVARRVVGMLAERGFQHIYHSWNGKIDQALGWEFP
jgi:predicted nucleotidyltransferase